MVRPLVVRLAFSGLLLASTSASAHAQVIAPAPPVTTIQVPPPAQLMPFTADAYPKVSTVAGGTIFKTTQLASTGQQALADRLLVSFAPSASAAETTDVHTLAGSKLKGMAARPVGQLSQTSFLVDVAGAPSLEEAARIYREDPRVIAVGPDTIGEIDETPNDPNFGSQWNMNKIQAPAAWNRTHGGGNAGRIAILDTGIDANHPDLAGKVVASKDFTGSSSGANDVHGHGTHVAGIAGAATNNGIKVAGVGHSVSLINAKVADDSGRVPLSAVINGINWASEEWGASVINMSLGASSQHFWDDCDPSWYEDLFDIGVNELRDALGDAWNRGAVLVATAGNTSNSFQQWPGACPNVLSVANTASDDTKAPLSSFGTWVDVAAPGQSILSLAPGGGTAFKSGSSMASPHVAGLAALVRSSCNLFEPQAIGDRIRITADAIAGTGAHWQFGRINAFKAVCFPKPSLRAGVVTSTSIEVKWSDPVPGETRFELFIAPAGQSFAPPLSLPANTTSYVHQNVAPGAAFDYLVRACDPNGCSELSNKIRVESNTRKLTVTRDGAGGITGQGINCGNAGSDCSEIYSFGTVVTLTAKDFVNTKLGIFSTFDHWEGACTGTSRTCTVNMTLNRTVRAVFVGDE